MKRTLAFLAAAGTASFLLTASLVSAQNTSSTAPTCSQADANNVQVKETCKGRIVESWDSNKCLWYKCVEETMSSSTDMCADAKANNAKVKASCPGGIVSRSWDANGCEWYKCAAEQPTTDVCAGARENNAKVKASCPADQIAIKSDGTCEWYWCKTPAPQSDCNMLLEKLKTMGSAPNLTSANTDEYMRLKKLYQEKCEKPQPPTERTTACKKAGCMVRCEDGTSYNVCNQQCTPTTTRGSSSNTGCIRKRVGKCIHTICGDKVEKKCSM